MDTPLYSALTALAQSRPLRLHMPGHKGSMGGVFDPVASIDFTELTPTDNLYTASGPIAQAEDLCATAAGAESALFLTGGSTQGIMTMLAFAVGPGGTVLLDRTCHRSVYHAMALLNITPVYVFRDLLPGTALSGPISPSALAAALDRCPAARAFLLVSPTYYGVLTELAPLAALCHQRRIPLLVDEAHGAHLPFLGVPGAVSQGADLAVASAHKTWPALGSSAILYAGRRQSKARLKALSALFGTSSPSYPILASIDYARARLEGPAGAAYRETAARTAALRAWIPAHTPFSALAEPLLSQAGTPVRLDPCRLTVETTGTTGLAAGGFWEAQNVYAEMADSRYLVSILTCADGKETFARLRQALLDLGTAVLAGLLPAAQPEPPEPPPEPHPRTSVRAALFSPSELLPLEAAAGRVAAGFWAPYPPGIPLIAPGEEITEKTIAYFRKTRYNRHTMIPVTRKDDAAI